MQRGPERFHFFLSQLEDVLAKAGRQKNPALYLYRNNARTFLFMLEGLSKLYGGIHNAKKFGKLKEHFKMLEDALGAIDYYDAVGKSLAGNKKIPAAVTQYIQAQTREKIQRLNELLSEKKWIGYNNERILKIKKKLKKADWLTESKETEAILEFYFFAIDEIIEFTKSTSYHFDNMEEDVHELRRKLRWLSIYPQALQGLVQLAGKKQHSRQLDKYLTKEITASPYNKMPDAGELQHFLLLDKNHFYSLSWMIDALGKLKDSGLQIVAVKEALIQSGKTDDAQLEKKAMKLLGKKEDAMKNLLKKAADLCEIYFREKNLQKMVLGTGKKYE